MTTLETRSEANDLHVTDEVTRFAISCIITDMRDYVLNEQLSLRRSSIIKRIQLSRQAIFLQDQAAALEGADSDKLVEIANVFKPTVVDEKRNRLDKLSEIRERISRGDEQTQMPDLDFVPGETD